VLNEASRAGARVPKPVFERGRAYLRAHLASDWERDPASSALALDVLAMLGEPDLGYTKRLLERADRLPLFAKGLVLHSLAIGNAPAALVAPLARDVENHLRVSGESAYVSENVGSEYAPLMDSPTRTSAIVLRALLAKDPKNALVVPLVRGLLGSRKNGGYRNTQENAFALLALDAYRRVHETRPPSFSASASLADTKLLDFRAEGKSTRTLGATLGMSEVSSRANALLSFEKDGSGTLFYQARLRYAPRELPKTSVDQGLFVSKTLRPIRPEELAKLRPNAPDAGVLRFHAGDLVVADLLVVTSSAREFVVVDDPLPAGFEPVDTGLRTTSSAFSSAGSEAEAPCDACENVSDEHEPSFATGYGQAWARQELRDDRALFFVDHMPGGIFHYRYFARATSAGRFVVPPTKAEGMYEPETFGRTAANLVEVE
jgi:uncharacterized protein YfaS (alpha-2-macroglobulin family)